MIPEEVTWFRARDTLDSLLDRVQEGEAFVITAPEHRRIAVLIGVDEYEEMKAAVEALSC